MVDGFDILAVLMPKLRIMTDEQSKESEGQSVKECRPRQATLQQWSRLRVEIASVPLLGALQA